LERKDTIMGAPSRDRVRIEKRIAVLDSEIIAADDAICTAMARKASLLTIRDELGAVLVEEKPETGESDA
jgi:hypothetical protein